MIMNAREYQNNGGHPKDDVAVNRCNGIYVFSTEKGCCDTKKDSSIINMDDVLEKLKKVV
jgi:hypothetical protein